MSATDPEPLVRADRDLPGLAVLALLLPGPRHTYEMHRLVVRTHKTFVKGAPRSLYHAVDRLLAAGLIRAGDPEAVDARPERRPIELTPAGRRRLREWTALLLATPDADDTLLEAALSFLACITPGDATDALRRRTATLRRALDGQDRARTAIPAGLPAVLLVEDEYLRERTAWAARWAEGLADRIERGDLDWPADVSALADLDGDAP